MLPPKAHYALLFLRNRARCGDMLMVVPDKRSQIRVRVENNEMSVQSRKLTRAKRKLQDAEKKLKRAERSVLSWRRKVADLTFERRSVEQTVLWSDKPAIVE